MDIGFDERTEAFRLEAAAWLEANLTGRFRGLIGVGGNGAEHEAVEPRLEWERKLGAAGWTCLGWPKAYGGRGASLAEQVVFNEEYAKAKAPGRVGHIGETLLGPTLIAHGSEAQKAQFLPPIRSGEALWCQGYSEPNAGSDLANVQTKAVLDGDAWVIEGQKIWTSLAQWSDWCFALCRTNPGAPKHRGISYLLVPMRQRGVEIRPIRQLTGTSEFAEVFFDGARTAKANVVGPVDGGWKIAMATLAFERGASTLGQQIGFAGELDEIIATAKRNGAAADPHIRRRLVDAWIGLKVMRMNALRTLSQAAAGELPRAAMINKLYWASWHRDLGELAMDVLGEDAEILEGPDYALSRMQTMFLFSRSDTIYAGSNQIQRNIIAERALGLPRPPKGK